MHARKRLQFNLDHIARSCPQCFAWFQSHAMDLQSLHQRLIPRAKKHFDYDDGQGRLFQRNDETEALYGDWPPVEHAAASASIILGAGMGQGIEKLLAETPASHRIVLLEPRPDLLAVFLGLTDISQAVSSKRLLLLPPDIDLLQRTLNTLDYQFYHGRIHYRVDGLTLALDNRYTALSEKIQDLLEGFTVEMSTMRRNQDLVISNELANYSRAFADGSVAGLENSLTGGAALLMGAGPSLSQVAPRLRKIAGNFIRVCALQTMPVLERLDIKPHFCLAIDPKQILARTYRTLSSEWAGDVPLIYAPRVHPEVVSRYPGPTLPLWTQGGLATLAFKGRIPVLQSNGNVNNASLRFLAWCGVRSFVLAGQDFSWPGESVYSPGHLGSDWPFRFDPDRHVQVTNSQGERVYTRRGYLAGLKEMENNLSSLDLNVWNIEHGGLPIRHAQSVVPDQLEATDLPCSDAGAIDGLHDILQNARQPVPRPVFERRASHWATSLKAAKKRIKKLCNTADRPRGSIRSTLEQMLLFVRQDPLYAPCLFTELMDLKGLAGIDRSYTHRDHRTLSAIVNRILTKIEHVDSAVGERTGRQAA